MKEKKLNALYALMQASFYIGFSGAMIYSTMFLRENRFSVSESGALLAVAYLAGIGIQQIAAYIGDHSRTISLKAVTLAHTLGAVVFLLPIVFLTLPKWALGICFLGSTAFIVAAQSILNALGMAYVQGGRRVNFGLGRGIGSFGFAGSSVLLGLLFEHRSVQLLALIMMLSGLLSSLFVLLLPRVPERRREECPPVPLRRFFSEYPVFLFFVVGVTLLFTTHSLLNTYMLYVVESVGGSSTQLGLVVAFAGFVELIPMVIYSLLQKRATDRWWLGLSMIAFTVKVIFLYFAQNVGMIFLSQGFQMLAFGLLTPSSTYYAAQVVREQDLIRGQAMILFAIILGGVFGNLTGGPLIDGIGIRNTLLIGIGISFVGTVISVRGLRQRNAQ
ncbi:MAG: MFS transporter [Ndongobacter sp.]|nr:MFS transporter [Ndongobacter sp.]